MVDFHPWPILFGLTTAILAISLGLWLGLEHHKNGVAPHSNRKERFPLAKLAVVGLGYVGLTTLSGLAALGHTVTGVDINAERVTALKSGIMPIEEPGLGEQVASQLALGKVSFISDYGDDLGDVQYFFICVPTPSKPSGEADLAYVNSSISSISRIAPRGATLILKSTLPIGTGNAVAEATRDLGLYVASNPEFLSEGNALWDFMNPSRIVVGAEDQTVSQPVMELYEGIKSPRIKCSLSSAESIKHASNSFLSVKLSFVNELTALSEMTGSNIDEVLLGVGLDPRIGPNFMRPGPGWGGSCFPKDTAELAHTGRKMGSPMLTVEAAIQSNSNSMLRVVDAVRQQLGGELDGKRIAVWGLSFKAYTDDTRDSPSLEVIRALYQSKALVKAYDPKAKASANESFLQVDSALEACRGSDSLVVLTEWPEFSEISPKEVMAVSTHELAVYDSRRILDASVWKDLFSNFRALGEK